MGLCFALDIGLYHSHIRLSFSANILTLYLPVTIQNCLKSFKKALLHKVLVLFTVEQEYLMFVVRLFLLDFFRVHCLVSTPLKHYFVVGVF